MPIITISRQMCSLGDEVAQVLSRKLGWELIDRNKLFSFLPKASITDYDIKMLTQSAKYYLKKSQLEDTFLDIITNELYEYTKNNSAIMMGFGSQIIFADYKDAIHVRITASKNTRMLRAKKQYRVSDIEAEKILNTTDRKHKRFVTTLFETDLSDPSYYHLIFNTASLSVDECVSALIAMLKERESIRQLEKTSENTLIVDNLYESIVFKNPSEEEFAKLLDMYQIDWKYEPKTFPVEWDAEGNVTMAFSPDFYLTKFDTYIELTTMDQRYVTQKNKKARKVRELYPGTNVKLVYKKDFYSLIERLNLNKGD